MGLVRKEVKKRIGAKLTEKFALVFDGRSEQSTHFVGVFAAIPSTDNPEYETILVSFSPSASETSFTAIDHYEQLQRILRLYSKSLDNVVALIETMLV